MRNSASVPLKKRTRITARKTAEPISAPVLRDSLTIPQLEHAIRDWLLDGEIRLSPKTVRDRRDLCDKLLWYLRRERFASCGKRQMQSFFAYLRTSHTLPEGRYGTPGGEPLSSRHTKEMRPRSIANYFRWLRTLFLFLVAEGTLDESPLRTMRPPMHRDDQIQPFTALHLSALYQASKESRYPRRDEALFLLLLDTGARASEVCGLTVADFCARERTIRVKGKGNTHRSLLLTAATTRAILRYLSSRHVSEDEPIFASERPGFVDKHLTTHGLQQIIHRMGQAADISGIRCSPHTFRHTFAVEFLRNGGDPIMLQTLYGHTSLEMTSRYVLFSDKDQKRKHQMFSPVSHLKK